MARIQILAVLAFGLFLYAAPVQAMAMPLTEQDISISSAVELRAITQCVRYLPNRGRTIGCVGEKIGSGIGRLAHEVIKHGLIDLGLKWLSDILFPSTKELPMPEDGRRQPLPASW